MDKFGRAVQIAEVIGAAAIVVSLIYVGSEIRQNTVALQDNSHQSSLTLAHDLEYRLWDAEFLATYDNGMRNYSTLSSQQIRQFDSYVSLNINVWEYAFYARERGVMAEDIWNGWDRYFRSQLNESSWQQVWRKVRHGYGDSFQAYTDSVATEQ
jgi:hypothetical protein